MAWLMVRLFPAPKLSTPINVLLPSVMGLFHVLLPLTFSSAPCPLKPVPLRVRFSVDTVMLHWTCRVPPLFTRVPPGPSRRVATTAVTPPLSVAEGVGGTCVCGQLHPKGAV